MSARFEKIKSEQENDEIIGNYEIKVYPADFTLQVLFSKWKEGQIEVPPFQREYVWRQGQASRLIESFLVGLPIPGIFLYNEKDSGKLLVIDGQQRLRSIFGFFEGKFHKSNRNFFLTGVNSKWDGKTFNELSKSDQRKFSDSVLRATIVDQINPKDHSSIFHIFERLNTGGTVLKEQEVRNCLYRGSFNDLLKELNTDKNWRHIFGSQKTYKRMRDVEQILRFFALREKSYQKPMKEFLSNYMGENRSPGKSELSEMRKIFLGATSDVIEHLGNKPFHPRRGFNVAICDAVMVAFSRGRHISKDIKKRHHRLIDNKAFTEYTTEHTTDVDAVKNRISLAYSLLFK